MQTNSTTRLTKIYRQEGGSIVLNANRVRRGNINLTQDASFRVHDYNVDAVIGQFIRLWDEENPPVILTALNQTVATLNKPSTNVYDMVVFPCTRYPSGYETMARLRW